MPIAHVPVPTDARLADAYRAAGLWSEVTVNSMLPRVAVRWPWLPAVSQGSATRTYGELLGEVQRVAGFLRSNGVGPGDVVCWQTPNWHEAYVLGLAVWHVGAISNPIVSIYRGHELGQIFGQLRPAAFVAAGEIRGYNHAQGFDQAAANAGVEPPCRIVLRSKQAGWSSFDAALAADPIDAADLAPDDPCLVLYTSGTTAAPKGVIHTSRTIVSETAQLVREWGLGWSDVGYMPAPLQHITGILIGMTVPVMVGGHSVLSDGWDAKRAIAEMLAHDVTFSAGATVFLQELTAAVTSESTELSLKLFACGGAPVPRAVMEAAEQQGIPAVRVYGLTEVPTVTLGNQSCAFDKRATTDGAIAAGVDIVAADLETGEFRPVGQEGELYVRGAERMAGYLLPEDNARAFSADGWLRTGDIGIVDIDGFVTITGRIKDVINRGGEKFSAREIEDILVSHPAVRQASVVPAPHKRFGEVPAAFIVPESATSETELLAYLEGSGLAAQKRPTIFRFVDALPMTPSGKVKKFELATLAAQPALEEVREDLEA